MMKPDMYDVRQGDREISQARRWKLMAGTWPIIIRPGRERRLRGIDRKGLGGRGLPVAASAGQNDLNYLGRHGPAVFFWSNRPEGQFRGPEMLRAGPAFPGRPPIASEGHWKIAPLIG